jgi:hypothetical protein
MDSLLAAPMPGASIHTRRVKILNANWTPSPEGGDGQFELMVVTDDDERYAIRASAASVAAIVGLATADTVLVWDPDGPTLICANVIGEMPWTRRQ